jgi:hypothetical protein
MNNSPMLFRCLSLLVVAFLAVYDSRAFCSDASAEMGVSRSQSTALGLSKRPVTVPDFIRMTRFGDPHYEEGGSSIGLVAKFSPDAKQFVVVLRKGNLEANTNEYSLVLFDSGEVFRSPAPRVLLSISSSSNRPAIQNVVWMDDNETILFMGEHPGETTQIYSFKCTSKELKKLTNHATNLSSFIAAPNGSEIVFAAENPEVPFVNENTARHGINVTNEALNDLLAGKHGGGILDDQTLFIKRAGTEAETRIATEGRVGPDAKMLLSPDGLHLVLQTEATHVSDLWTEYSDRFLQASRRTPSAPGSSTSVLQYELVDTRTGLSSLLLDAPISPFGSEGVWSPDSQSIVLSNAYLPLNIDEASERAQRKAYTFLAEVKISSHQVLKLSSEDLRVLEWDARSNDVVCDVGRIDSLTGKSTSKAHFRKSGETWSRSNAPEQIRAHSVPDIILEEGMNAPPHIVAVDLVTGRKSQLMDLNPQFQDLAFARVEEITWKDAHGIVVKGGLYWPPDYVAGKRYPLVIQTHAWNPDRFWIDGPYTTAFAAQALAGKGFFVLQVPDPDWHLAETPKEAPAAMAIYDSAIDLLDRKGLIERDRVGITGFSRTYWYVTYALTHSKKRFAAADVADGVDYDYFQYMAFSNTNQTLNGDFDLTIGAPPFGKGLLKWLEASPAFLMDRIQTPLRIQDLLAVSLLGDWPWFTGLTRLGKPVEMIYIPEGTHILEKPWDRMVSQQGNVDWFCFWLKGEEDPDPEKAEQYQRWRALRQLQQQNPTTREGSSARSN